MLASITRERFCVAYVFAIGLILGVLCTVYCHFQKVLQGGTRITPNNCCQRATCNRCPVCDRANIQTIDMCVIVLATTVVSPKFTPSKGGTPRKLMPQSSLSLPKLLCPPFVLLVKLHQHKRFSVIYMEAALTRHRKRLMRNVKIRADANRSLEADAN